MLALAWAFDVTPRGIERTGAAPANDTSGSTPKMTTAGGVTPIATSAAATTSTRDGAKSLAILPFADLSAERDQDYFCDGIAEEIINALCSIRGLKIASRTSAFQFKGKSADVREIGRTLGVDSVLEGSVRKAGDRVRITAQLIGAGDGYHLWSESFDRRLEDIFAIQREIAQQIVRCLKRNLQSADEQKLDRGGTTNIDAYEFYLRGRAMLRGQVPASGRVRCRCSVARSRSTPASRWRTPDSLRRSPTTFSGIHSRMRLRSRRHCRHRRAQRSCSPDSRRSWLRAAHCSRPRISTMRPPRRTRRPSSVGRFCPMSTTGMHATRSHE